MYFTLMDVLIIRLPVALDTFGIRREKKADSNRDIARASLDNALLVVFKVI
jgi:hypothetical protein